ncbi:uncharacterized protein METZ01_LOCUS420774 [marine metagenome]|uniref:Uncharacterized protein n=1 Tax=marine metagenome TaxID=408172 RepID=A0A382XAN6_9ZZZZ
MPNRKAKTRKQKRKDLDKKWATEGRTANQHKKWLAKQKEKGPQISVWGKT